LKPTIVHLDYETQSACDLRACGAWVYSEHPSTRAYCAAMKIEYPTGAVQHVFWTDVERTLTMPPGVDYEHGIGFFQAMLTDPDSEIWIVAHNADFERAITTRTLKLPEPAKWLDTADLTLMRGLPAGADHAGQYLFNLPKDALGYQLMMRVCKPNKKGQIPIITDSIVQALINYVFRDVEISERISDRFGLLANPPREQEVRELSHDINEMGIGFDRHFAETLQRMDEWFKARACERVEEVTNGEVKRANLTQVDKLRGMINANLPEGYQLENMRASSLEEIIDEDEELGQNSPFSAEVIEVIKARQIIARAALAKVDTALRACCSDGRIRGQFRYWGAGPGRWSGYQTQPQNMKRPHEDFDLPTAIAAIENEDEQAFVNACTDTKGRVMPPYELLGSLVRGIFVPAPGHVYVNADWSAIEARKLMWLSDDEEGMQEHIDADNGTIDDVYCAFASKIYNTVVRKKTHKKERGIGKIGQLACGYNGGEGAINRFATAAGVDLTAAGITALEIRDAWRAKYHKTVQLWRDYDAAMRMLLTTRRSDRQAQMVHHVRFEKFPDRVEIELPSKRRITYMNCRLGTAKKHGELVDDCILYDTAVKGRVRTKTIYGGLITENIDQGSCACLLREALLNITDAGYPIPLHVHDEINAEVPESRADEACQRVKEIMETAPDWCQGLPLKAEPATMRRFGK
jgi:DNA polymerase